MTVCCCGTCEQCREDHRAYEEAKQARPEFKVLDWFQQQMLDKFAERRVKNEQRGMSDEAWWRAFFEGSSEDGSTSYLFVRLTEELGEMAAEYRRLIKHVNGMGPWSTDDAFARLHYLRRAIVKEAADVANVAALVAWRMKDENR